ELHKPEEGDVGDVDVAMGEEAEGEAEGEGEAQSPEGVEVEREADGVTVIDTGDQDEIPNQHRAKMVVVKVLAKTVDVANLTPEKFDFVDLSLGENGKPVTTRYGCLYTM
ncbi:hypothetical protein KIPB_014860, partial [Kipferlia bialata]